MRRGFHWHEANYIKFFVIQLTVFVAVLLQKNVSNYNSVTGVIFHFKLFLLMLEALVKSQLINTFLRVPLITEGATKQSITIYSVPEVSL